MYAVKHLKRTLQPNNFNDPGFVLSGILELCLFVHQTLYNFIKKLHILELGKCEITFEPLLYPNLLCEHSDIYNAFEFILSTLHQVLVALAF